MREAYHVDGGGVCEYEIDEKRGGSEAWTVRREEGKLVFVVGTPAREAYQSMCAAKKELGAYTHRG